MKIIRKAIMVSILVSLLASCGNFVPESTETPTSTATSVPTSTDTPEPTSTLTATPVSPSDTPFPPEFSNLSLALSIDKTTHAPQSIQDIFPLGIGHLEVFFDYQVPEKTKLLYSIYYGNEAIIESQAISVESGTGTMAFPIRKEYGFQDEGPYELRITKDEQVVLNKTFQVTWLPTIWPIAFSENIDITGKVANPTTSFPNGTTSIFAFFEMANMKVGDQILKEWLLDGNIYQQSVYIWENPDWSLGKHADKLENQIQDQAILPVGEYEFRVYVNGELKQSGTFAIR